MKKKLLSLTVAAALAGVGTAQAVSVNPDGLGEVLIFPYYTVEGNQDTYINLVNTTGNTKAVKVRFLEAMNSQEVLDFNLYLSPYDHWSAVITRDADGEGAVIKTADTSCTVPNSLAAPSEGTLGPAIKFRDFEYEDDSVNGLARTREGYVEVIEMAELEDSNTDADQNVENAIEHSNGVPGDCSVLASAWADANFLNGNNTGVTEVPPAGGLYGYGVLIDVDGGTDATYDAVALDEFSDAAIHNRPGSNLPSLNQVSPADGYIIDGNTVVPASFVQTSTPGANPVTIEKDVDAVSAVLMHNSIANDYVLEPGLNAGTDWVVTFPTKRYYVNEPNYLAPTDPNSDVAASLRPFTTGWDSGESQACEEITIEYYDREEREVTTGLDFSPERSTAALSLCFEANVVTFNNSNVLQGSARVSQNLNVLYNNGWARIGLANDKNGTTIHTLENSEAAGGGAPAFSANGLPTVGFAVQRYVNSDVGGLLSNYAGSVTHKSTRDLNN